MSTATPCVAATPHLPGDRTRLQRLLEPTGQVWVVRVKLPDTGERVVIRFSQARWRPARDRRIATQHQRNVLTQSDCAVGPCTRPDCSIEPAIPQTEGRVGAVLQHVLAVKVRSLSIRRGNSMNHGEITRLIELVHFAERRMQAE